MTTRWRRLAAVISVFDGLTPSLLKLFVDISRLPLIVFKLWAPFDGVETDRERKSPVGVAASRNSITVLYADPGLLLVCSVDIHRPCNPVLSRSKYDNHWSSTFCRHSSYVHDQQQILFSLLSLLHCNLCPPQCILFDKRVRWSSA